jgi:FMN-dependent NADH-azoreductase
MKIHLVHYAPGDPSVSKEIVSLIKPLLTEKGELDGLNLVQTPPDFFLENNMSAYVNRNFLGKELSSKELESLKKMDDMADRLLDSDYLVMVFPMYNFSQPAIIKAWIDSVAQAKKVFKYTEYGPQGLLKIKEAIVIQVTGLTPQNASNDFTTKYMEYILKFMGVKNVISTGVFGTRYSWFTEEVREKLLNEIKMKMENWK